MKKILLFLLLITLTFNMKTVNAEMAPMNCQNSNLQVGSTGEEVKKLQNELNIIMKCNLDIDGVIGSRTKKCILEFQKKYNLTTDGIVGTKTCTKLNKLYSSKSTKTYVVVTNKVNVRSGANNTSTIKSTMERGKILRVYDVVQANGNTWYKVYTKYTTVDDNYGYINARNTKNTAILVDISEQQLKYFYAGKLTMVAPVITGKKGYETPTGNFVINPKNKAINKTITGINSLGNYYTENVNYWMPFSTIKKLGFHDAPWRNVDDYTKTTYTENGTLGNINMRHNDAERLFANITESTYVIIRN